MGFEKLKGLMKEKNLGPNAGKNGAEDFDVVVGKKHSFMKGKSAAPAKKSGLAARLTGKK